VPAPTPDHRRNELWIPFRLTYDGGMTSRPFMFALLLLGALAASAGCADDDDDASLPPIESLAEGNELAVASEQLGIGAITLSADATAQRDARGCTVTVTVTQSASDGVLYSPLGDRWPIDRVYVLRGGGVWSAAPEIAEAVPEALRVIASGAPNLEGSVDVVVRFPRKDADGRQELGPAYLARRNVMMTCSP
jgi:hypothetical protein